MLKKIHIVTAIMVFAAGMAFAAPADVPKTGQTTSSATGDDGDLQKGFAWPNPRFTVASSGKVVTDNLTRLMWLQDANCISTKYPGFDNDGSAGDGRVLWQHALDFVAGINAGLYPDCGGGHTDWRLPNVNELESLVHAEYTKETTCGGACTSIAAWLNTQGFSNVQIANYWSSTTYAGNTPDAWYVDIIYGGVYSNNKLSFSYCVWLVRSGQ